MVRETDRVSYPRIRQSLLAAYGTETELENDGQETPNKDVLDIQNSDELVIWVKQDPTQAYQTIDRLRRDYEETLVEAEHTVKENTRLNQETDKLKRDLADRHDVVDFLRNRIQTLNEEAEIREATPTSSIEKIQKTTKIPDPPIFKGDRDEIEEWLVKIRNKLRANHDHYPTEEAKLAYAETRIEGNAAKQIRPRMNFDNSSAFRTVQELLEYLKEIYGDPHRKQTVLAEYRALRQDKRDFNTFWGEFQRLAAELEDYSESYKIEDLYEKLAWSIKKQLAIGTERATSLTTLARQCQRIDHDLKAISKTYDRKASPKGTNRIPTTPTTNTAAGTTTPPARTPHQNPAKEQLMKEGRCFGCGEIGHLAKDCPSKKKKFPAPKQVRGTSEEPNEDSEN